MAMNAIIRQDLKDILCANKYVVFDILPLIGRHLDGKSENEAKSVYMSFDRIIEEWMDLGMIEFISKCKVQLSLKIERDKHESILIRTLETFEDNFWTKPIQTIQHFSTYGNNSPIAGNDLTIGAMVQPLSNTSFLNPSQKAENIQPAEKAKTVKRALLYVGGNILRIIDGILIVYICYLLGIKK